MCCVVVLCHPIVVTLCCVVLLSCAVLRCRRVVFVFSSCSVVWYSVVSVMLHSYVVMLCYVIVQ